MGRWTSMRREGISKADVRSLIKKLRELDGADRGTTLVVDEAVAVLIELEEALWPTDDP